LPSLLLLTGFQKDFKLISKIYSPNIQNFMKEGGRNARNGISPAPAACIRIFPLVPNTVEKHGQRLVGKAKNRASNWPDTATTAQFSYFEQYPEPLEL
jgi:hypothetical protein